MNTAKFLTSGAAALAGALLLAAPAFAQETTLTGDTIPTEGGDLVIHPIMHATFAMSYGGQTIDVDPTGGAAAFEGLPTPDLILITDIHPDHFDPETIAAAAGEGTAIVAPQAVYDMLPTEWQGRVTVLNNGDTETVADIQVEAIPAYNTTEDRLQFHPMGRGNGYVVTLGDTRVYIAGDTEGVPEMRALQDIDVAFIPMNLPYTMTPEQAADAVLAFQPRIVYPYHYMGSDTQAFADLVHAGNPDIEVRLHDWYGGAQ